MAAGHLDHESSLVMAKAATENFPVSPWFLPRASRAHLQAFYGYARLVDDAGDEKPADRLLSLDEIEQELDRVFAGTPRHPLMRALQSSVHTLGVPREPLQALVQANRQDLRITRYARFDDLMAYCELSANPVGHLVLYAFSAVSPERLRLSGRICTALQLVDQLQDVGEDLARGRIYLPQEDLARFGCDERALSARVADERVRRLITFEASRAERLLDEGTPLVRLLRGRPALAVAGFIAGGRAALDAIARAGGDVLGNKAKPSRRGVARALVRTGWGAAHGARHGRRVRLV